MLSEELIAKIGNAIDAIPPKPASRREIDLLITQLEAKIRAAQERDCTYGDIAKLISDCGYPIKTSTLRVALQRRRKNQPAKPRTQGKKPAIGPAAERAPNVTADQPAQRRP
jgi:hypothetical protein